MKSASVSAIEWKPATPLEVCELLKDNFQGGRQPVRIVGGGTSWAASEFPEIAPVILRTSGLQNVIDYPARDMTITVEAGLTLSALQEILQKEHQQLPIDVPQADQATVGGAIASNASGPGRFGYGTFRDYLLGVSAVDGQGRLFSAGGRVVKNVAGYDLCKLMIGSQGSLGVITQVTLKLVPVPSRRGFLVFGFPDSAALESALQILNLSATQPAVQDVLNAAAGHALNQKFSLDLPEAPCLLCLGYAGTAEEVAWQFETAVSELHPASSGPLRKFEAEAADVLWKSLTEFQTSQDQTVTLRASILPSQVHRLMDDWSSQGIAVQGHAGNGILIGHASEQSFFSDRKTRAEFFSGTTAGENASLVVASSSGAILTSVHSGSSAGPTDEFQQQLKTTFDPAGMFSPLATLSARALSSRTA